MGERYKPVPKTDSDKDLILPGVYPSTNRKISPLCNYRTFTRRGREEAERFDIDRLGAAFGLASGPEHSCSGATEFCANDCYSIEAERTFSGTGNSMRRNYEQLKAASFEQMRATCSAILNGYNLRCERMGVPADKRIFRWHWAGDIFSRDYARAIAAAFNENPTVMGAIYTRVYQPDLNVVPELIKAPNLRVFLSVDPDNLERAAEVYREYHRSVRLAFLGQDYHHGRTLAEKMAGLGVPDLDVTQLVEASIDSDGHMPYSYPDLLYCPELYPYGKKRRDGSRSFLSLTVPDYVELKIEQANARAEAREVDISRVKHRGACSACMACYSHSALHTRHVIFVKNKEMHSQKGTPGGLYQAAMSEVLDVPVEIARRRRPASLAVANQVSLEDHPSLFD
ncbi:hypothetical protein KC878_03510 [Candidatus Saccharibacteria bacterium]|nr:hypothetical protein [Candidatus Saccharibacteria bacterium]MCB9821395.1 hypothetical protein [Candidatus Nomurabacteria bacterium]